MTNALSFDLFQFAGRKAYAVTANFEPDGSWSSPGLSYDDVRRCHVATHKLAPGRRLDAPVWAFNQSAMRKLLVAYLESRAGQRRHRTGPLSERFERARVALRARVPHQVDTLKKLCHEYVELKREAMINANRLRKLEVQIRALDSQILIANRVAEIVVGIVYYYFSCGFNSVQVAAALSIRPPHVRQVLWRLAHYWSRMQEHPFGRFFAKRAHPDSRRV